MPAPNAVALEADDLLDLLHADAGTEPEAPGRVHVLDLDPYAPAELDRLARQVHALGPAEALRPPLVVATSSHPLDASIAPLLAPLTLTLAPDAPGRAWVRRRPTALVPLLDRVAQAPYAAATLDRLLRGTADAEVRAAVESESATYQLLLGSAEFTRWLADRGEATPPPDVTDAVLLERHGDALLVTLHRPERRNAFGRCLRDALVEALDLAVLDPSVSEVRLVGAGPAFSAGGDLAEFGTAGDPAATHLVRLAQHPGLAVHRVRERVHAHLHGACVGAGIEVPAFAGRVSAADGTWFQLPELAMGLVPGAGGTVSVPRRIGRWRTAWMVLSGERIDLDEALAWGLVDARE